MSDSNDDFLKPKNQTLESRKKAEQVFIPELHSAPELMSYSEKLELGEEILCEILQPVLEREGMNGEVEDVQGSEFLLSLNPAPTVSVSMELEFLVSELTRGIFTLRIKG